MLLLALLSCNSQPVQQQSAALPTVGGNCDGCDLMYINMPKNIGPVDTSAGWHEAGDKLLVKGIVFKKDGKTPANNVILYYWQTDNNGLYSPAPGMDSKAKRHGHIRGWIKTDEAGRYTLYTVRPASYPNTTNPAHIHVVIKEPELANEYYIDDFVFDDDRLLNEKVRKQLENRGGSGILNVVKTNNMQTAERNIILGLNVEGYP